jgi:cellulose synthase/poly-beta-1,6-N-acetylglucosamine synthase-like glycosyltransferase
MSLGLIAYTYLIYPALVIAWEKLTADLGEPEVKTYPSVSMVISAWNEEEVLEEKIQNCLALEYPAQKVEFLIGSDASTDRTNEILKSLADERFRIRIFSQRRGKSAVLNRLVPQAEGELIVFSDANSQYQPDALKKITRWFTNPAVGGVCGRLKLINATGEPGGEGEGLYWRFEDQIKQAEGSLHSVISANGAILAIRKELYRELPEDRAVNDDLILTAAVVKAGKRMIYEPEAVAVENTSPDMGHEFSRKIRVSVSNFNSLPEAAGMLHPRSLFSSWAFFSHKILRWMVPLFGLGMLLSNFLLLQEGGMYPYLFGGQMIVYLGALLGFLGDLLWGSSGPFIPFYYLAMINLAIVIGAWRTIFGEQQGAWDRIPRT